MQAGAVNDGCFLPVYTRITSETFYLDKRDLHIALIAGLVYIPPLYACHISWCCDGLFQSNNAIPPHSLFTGEMKLVLERLD